MLLAATFLTLGGCGSTGSIEPGKIALSGPPASAMIYCADPVDIPAPSTMNGARKEALVATDRLNLADCGRRHYVLIQHVRAQQAAFAQTGGGA